jgi:hypothetical protein
MVNAIRYWGQAFKLLEEAPNPDRPRLPWLVPSAHGGALMGDDGWDPYVEASGTLWLLHWWLLRPVTKAPVWWITFNAFQAVHFTDSSLHRFVMEVIESAGGWTDVIESSLKKDVDCVIRMYAPKHADQAIDDLIDCPFRELQLIEAVPGEARTYRFVAGPKPTLPDAIVAYATLDFMAQGEGSATMSIARLAQDIGSPGRAFRLTESSIFDSLNRFARQSQYVRVAQPAGLKQVLVERDPANLAVAVLEAYYRSATGSSRRIAVSRLPSSSSLSAGQKPLLSKAGTAANLKKAVKYVAQRLASSEDPAERAVLLAETDRAIAKAKAYLDG